MVRDNDGHTMRNRSKDHQSTVHGTTDDESSSISTLRTKRSPLNSFFSGLDGMFHPTLSFVRNQRVDDDDEVGDETEHANDTPSGGDDDDDEDDDDNEDLLLCDLHVTITDTAAHMSLIHDTIYQNLPSCGIQPQVFHPHSVMTLQDHQPLSAPQNQQQQYESKSTENPKEEEEVDQKGEADTQGRRRSFPFRTDPKNNSHASSMFSRRAGWTTRRGLISRREPTEEGARPTSRIPTRYMPNRRGVPH